MPGTLHNWNTCESLLKCSFSISLQYSCTNQKAKTFPATTAPKHIFLKCFSLRLPHNSGHPHMQEVSSSNLYHAEVSATPFLNYKEKNLGIIKFTGKMCISFSEARFHSTTVSPAQAEHHHPSPSKPLNIFFVQTSLLLLWFFFLFFLQWSYRRELHHTFPWYSGTMCHILCFYYNLQWNHDT